MGQRALAVLAATALVALLSGACTPGGTTGPGGQDVAATADSGLIALDSPYQVQETLQRVETAAKGKGLEVYGVFDLTSEYKQADASLRPTMFIVVGNPKVDALLLNQEQGMGVVYPLKLLAWEDAQQKVHLAYLDPTVVAARFGVTGQDELVRLTADTFRDLAQAAVSMATLAAPQATLAPGEVRTLPPPTAEAGPSEAPASGGTP